MSLLIKGMEMPKDGCHHLICIYADGTVSTGGRLYTAIPVPTPHGDLIDRDVLMKDGWLCLYKEVIRMGGYAIHELPLINPLIPVIIKAEE